VGLEDGEVGGRPGLGPGLVGASRNLCQLSDQLLRNPDRFVVVASQQSQGRLLFFRQRLLRELVDECPHLGVDETGVCGRLEGGLGPRASGRARRRHHRCLVPVQQLDRTGEIRELAQSLDYLIPGRTHL
jgi:hypothetical protein